MDGFLQDVRYGCRQLVRSRGFTAVAALTLALGIGANTAIFTIVNGVLLRPLPYPEPDELVQVWGRFLPESGYDFPIFSLAEPEYLDYRRENRALAGVAAYRWEASNLSDGVSEPERVRSAAVSANLFDVLALRPALGRTFLPEEDSPGAPCAAVLSFGIWSERFGADAGVLGRPVFLDGKRCEVVGVMPESFRFPDPRIRLWTPLALDTANPRNRGSHDLSAIGRLESGVSFEEAEAEMELLMESWAREFPDVHGKGHFLFLTPLYEQVIGSVRLPLLVVSGAVGFVLLIVCANVANLLFVRGEARRREIALRAALGAGRGRIVRQLLSESFLLSALGGSLGLVLAVWSVDAMLGFYPGQLPRLEEVQMDARVLLFTLAVSAGAAVLFGLLPALRSSSLFLQDALKSGGRSPAGAGGSSRLRRVLVVGEVAASLALLIAAGLLMRSFWRLQQTDAGLDPEDVVALSLSVPEGAYPETTHVRQFYEGLMERIGAMPGVEAAGAVSSLPLLTGAPPDDFRIEGRPVPAPGETAVNADYVMVTPGLFETLRIPLRRGRLFDRNDTRTAPFVAVVNETLARTYWPGEDAVGKRVCYPTSPDECGPWITVVGVAGDVRSRQLAAAPRPALYAPHAQSPREESYPGRFMTLVARAKVRSTDIASSMRAAVRERDPSLPVASVLTMEEVFSRSLAQPRFTTLLMAFFASAALLLAAVGLYGVISYVVEERRQEIGVRMALGATAVDVRRLFVGEGMLLTGIGLALGVAGAVVATRLLASLLFGVTATDPATFVGVTALLALVSLLACLVPALRASRLDPVRALRGE